jgi:hypothetical protein
MITVATTSAAPTFLFSFTYPERRTAGTGGIERVETYINRSGEFTAKITGRLLEPIPRAIAPNYNRKSPNVRQRNLFPHLRDSFCEHMTFTEAASLAEELTYKYEAAHLWGPGFGDEAAAGIMWAHINFNQQIQNRLLEKIARDWHKQAAKRGYVIRVEAVGVAYSRHELAKLKIPGQLKFLNHVQYKFIISDPAGDERSYLFLAEAGPPHPDSQFKLSHFAFHGIERLADVFF